jgi:pimeloyl-ACP methyl ester carboxylesterase
MRGEFVEVGQYRLNYYAAGTRGQVDPIVLIHGFPTSGHLWSNLVSLLPAVTALSSPISSDSDDRRSASAPMRRSRATPTACLV